MNLLLGLLVDWLPQLSVRPVTLLEHVSKFKIWQRLTFTMILSKAQFKKSLEKRGCMDCTVASQLQP
jgi:hypothetical protein